MTRLHTEVRGSGPALVLLHGWGLNVRVWDGLAAALCDRFRIVAIDLPGHGRSAWLPERSSLAEQAAQVHETIAGVTAKYSLLGWSFGGQIALQLAAAQHAADARGTPLAATVDRLVLIATTPRLVAAPDWPHGAPPERLAAQAAGLRTDYRRTVSDFLELQVRGSAGGAEALDQLRAALFAHGLPAAAATADGESQTDMHERASVAGLNLAALARDLELLRDTDLRPQIADITLPALVIAGQYDRVTMPAASHALAQALPNARYAEIRRAAHAPFLSHLARLTELLCDFLLQP
ncbi:MAG: alpha/beta fold hydrolase [Gammaproteobacteria bacterium]|nr:alpha/beta fold hydrolase [Gammaproteobacteria bacterium]